MRLVIQTSNLRRYYHHHHHRYNHNRNIIISHDYEWKTQGIYIQDFPLKQHGNTNTNTNTNGFYEDLQRYMKHIKLHQTSLQCEYDNDYVKRLDLYDFSSAEVIMIIIIIIIIIITIIIITIIIITIIIRLSCFHQYQVIIKRMNSATGDKASSGK